MKTHFRINSRYGANHTKNGTLTNRYKHVSIAPMQKKT